MPISLPRRSLALGLMSLKLNVSSVTNRSTGDAYVASSVDEKKEKKHKHHEKRYMRATKDYAAKDDKELSLKKGDIVRFRSRDQSGYVEGQLGEKTGYFPADVVEEVTKDGQVMVRFVTEYNYVTAGGGKLAALCC